MLPRKALREASRQRPDFRRFWRALWRLRRWISIRTLLKFLFTSACVALVIRTAFAAVGLHLLSRERDGASSAPKPVDLQRREKMRASLSRVHDRMPSPSPWPLESTDEIPSEKLYGTSGERCFAIGVNSEASSLWQPNSRALCFNPNPVCLYGPRMDQVLSFRARGTAECNVLQVNTGTVTRATHQQLENSSCARFRSRRIMSMFAGSGEVHNENFDEWLRAVSPKRNAAVAGRHRIPIEWQRDFAIVVPKYDWSLNICHYNRIWQFILYSIRHIELLVPDPSGIREINILFRSRPEYDNSWASGLRSVTIPAVENETNFKINVRKVRFDPNVEYKCFHRAIFLGQEGRVDAHPFLNDSATWSKDLQIDDSHIPVIPHDALWFRNLTYRAYKLPEVGEFAGGTFVTIPVPPLRVGFIQRSSNSKRRFSASSKTWFVERLEGLARKYSFQIDTIQFSGRTDLGAQVSLARNIGVAVGIHGANFVNSMFMPPAAALFEVFPYRYVRYYYASGGNSGLRYSFHETTTGTDRNCDPNPSCFFLYRESEIHLIEEDRVAIEQRLESAMLYIVTLHKMFPAGRIPLQRRGNSYYIHGFEYN